jgi:hypothetical protein
MASAAWPEGLFVALSVFMVANNCIRVTVEPLEVTLMKTVYLPVKRFKTPVMRYTGPQIRLPVWRCTRLDTRFKTGV